MQVRLRILCGLRLHHHNNPVAEPHLVLIFVCVVGECNYSKEDDAREEGTSRQLVYVSSLKCVAFVLGFDTVWSDDAYVSDNNGR